MPFETDTEFAAEIGQDYGDYLSTFISEHQQVRADIFRRGDHLEAHVSFLTELDATNVTDRYVSILREYARQQGFEGRLQLFLSDD